MTKFISSDVSRCSGIDAESKCSECARKQQIETDDPAKWFPYMQPAINHGVCAFFITVKQSMAQQSTK